MSKFPVQEVEETEINFLWNKMWIPGKVFPEDLKTHLREHHQFEAPDHLSDKELDELHQNLHK